MTEPKFCVNCKFVVEATLVCGHANAHHSLVDGQPDVACFAMRQARPQTNACGPAGDWYEAKSK